MSLYERYVLPKLIDAAMRGPEMTALRQQALAPARGKVLEIGIGSALNLRYYGDEVTSLVGVDPSEGLAEIARSRIDTAPFPVELINASAESMPLPSSSIDTVVVTWTLCSIPDVYRSLREVRRILRRDGQLLFVEHGLSSDRSVQQWQYRWQPLWKVFSGGCHLTRNPDQLLGDAGFTVTSLQRPSVPGPKIATCMYLGQAVVDA